VPISPPRRQQAWRLAERPAVGSTKAWSRYGRGIARDLRWRPVPMASVTIWSPGDVFAFENDRAGSGVTTSFGSG